MCLAQRFGCLLPGSRQHRQRSGIKHRKWLKMKNTKLIYAVLFVILLFSISTFFLFFGHKINIKSFILVKTLKVHCQSNIVDTTGIENVVGVKCVTGGGYYIPMNRCGDLISLGTALSDSSTIYIDLKNRKISAICDPVVQLKYGRCTAQGWTCPN